MPSKLRFGRVGALVSPGRRSLCLLVGLAVACSVDIGKLQAPKVGSADGPPTPPGPADAGELDLAGPSDRPEAAPDRAIEAADRAIEAADGVGDRDGSSGDGVEVDAVDVAADVALGDDGSVPPDVPDDVPPSDVASEGSSDGHRGTGGVAGTGGGGGTGGVAMDGGSGGIGGDLDPVLWYKFDESSGTKATDSSPGGGGTHDGTLVTFGRGAGSSATFSTDSQVGTHAVSLSPASLDATSGGGYITIPELQSLAPDALTLAIWVKLSAATKAQNWERVLDCGSGAVSSGGYYYITARASDPASGTGTPLRFGISQTAHKGTGEQRLEASTTLTASVWHHIAVVLPSGVPYTGILYIDGAVAATNSEMTLHLSDLATATDNWLGRSAFTEDPFFLGSLDDFRVYRRALSKEEVQALYTLQ